MTWKLLWKIFVVLQAVGHAKPEEGNVAVPDPSQNIAFETPTTSNSAQIGRRKRNPGEIQPIADDRSESASEDHHVSSERVRRGTEGGLVISIPNPDHPDAPTRKRRDSHGSNPTDSSQLNTNGTASSTANGTDISTQEASHDNSTETGDKKLILEDTNETNGSTKDAETQAESVNPERIFEDAVAKDLQNILVNKVVDELNNETNGNSPDDNKPTSKAVESTTVSISTNQELSPTTDLTKQGTGGVPDITTSTTLQQNAETVDNNIDEQSSKVTNATKDDSPEGRRKRQVSISEPKSSGSNGGETIEVLSTTGPLGAETADVLSTNGSSGNEIGQVLSISGSSSGETADALSTTGSPGGETDEVLSTTGSLSGETAEVLSTTGSSGGETAEVLSTTGSSSGETAEILPTTGSSGGEIVEVLSTTGSPGGEKAGVLITAGSPVGETAEVLSTIGSPGVKTVEVLSTTSSSGGKTAEVLSTTIQTTKSDAEKDLDSIPIDFLQAVQKQVAADKIGSNTSPAMASNSGITPTQVLETSGMLTTIASPSDNTSPTANGNTTVSDTNTGIRKNESTKSISKRESPAEPGIEPDSSGWRPEDAKYESDGKLNPFEMEEIMEKEEAVLEGPSLAEGPEEVSHNGVLTVEEVPLDEEVNVDEDGGKGTREERIIEDEVHQVEKYEKIKNENPNEPPKDPVDENELLWAELKKEEEKETELDKKINNTETDGRRRRRSNIRVKRFLNNKPSLRWTKGIVPYSFDKTLSVKLQGEVLATMARFEKYTCIRYVPYEGEATRAKYGLDHDGHMIFLKKDAGCWANQGNKRKKVGQEVSCCARLTCIHELGHAMGLYHEHQSPMREGWNRVNWKNIKKSGYKWYKGIPKEAALAYGYDFTNPMHYGRTEFGNGNGPTQSVLFKELQSITHGYHNPFYLFAEISRSHQCDKLHCSAFKGKCVNGGYLSLVHGKCGCNCPDNLDPGTNCVTMRKKLPPTKWPKGTYSLLEPREGCPAGFKQGSIKHWSVGHSIIGKPFNLSGEYMSTMFKHQFCSITDNKDGGEWERGQYCIFRRGGTCPKGFEEGFVQFDDSSKQAGQDVKPEVKDAIPDGSYGKDVGIQTCCRDDGYIDEAITLPLDKPFVLLPLVFYHDCQHVKGAVAVNEFMRFANDKTGAAKLTGKTKFVFDMFNKFKIHFCYYIPTKRDCGGVISLNDDKPEVTFTSPGYPSLYDDTLECSWLVKGPTNSNVVLKFEDFDFESGKKRCKDSLEIRYNQIGQTGFKYCGDKFDKNIRSINNFVVLNMKTDMGGRRKGFKARVTLVRPKDMCYNVSDRGQTYRGKVNYDRDFRSCIPWRKTTNCPHHQYQSEQTGAPLEDNYCRNPDHTFTPWCYILNSEGECERNYCDACGLEDAYDKVGNCKKLKEEGFCSKPKEEVLPKCAKTCSAAAPKEKSITLVKCPAPEKLADSDIVGELKSSYSVGDTVKYQCKTGNESHIISCLSDGSWSPGKYVCGACSTGWLASGGVCLKYFSQPLTFVMAAQFCQTYGGSVADAKTKEQMEFLVSIRTKTLTMWIGLNDVKEEGKFVWSDETPLVWNNWSKGSPNNNYNMEDCVIMYGEQLDNKWNDHPCRSKYYQYSFTCQNKPSKRVLCVNRREDCKKLLQADPKMCISRRDFSSENCAADCGICKTSQEVKSCDVVAATPNVILDTQGKKVSTGHVVRYKCKPGFVQDSGDKVRSCMVDRSLSGKPLVCKSSESVIEPSNNVQLHRFTRIGNQCQMYTSSNDNFRIKRSGEIIKWEFYSVYSGQAALVVFRPTNDKFQFQVIGINQLVKSSDDSLQTLAIPPNERIKVKPNDQIGIWYAYKRAGIPFVYCDGAEHPEADNTLQLKGYMCNPNHLQVDKVYSFNKRRILCRIFSLRAQIGPVSK